MTGRDQVKATTAAPDTHAMRDDLVRFALGIDGMSEDKVGNTSSLLLEKLLRFCLAPRGALVVPDFLTERFSTPGTVMRPFGMPVRVLAATHMSTLDGAPSPLPKPGAFAVVHQDAAIWATCAVPLGAALVGEHTARREQDEQPGAGLLLAGYHDTQEGNEAAARLQRVWSEIADLAGIALTTLLLAERMALAPAIETGAPDAAEMEAEEELPDWEQTFDAISDPVSVITPDYRIVRANAAYRRYFQASSDVPLEHTCFATETGQGSPCAGCPLPGAVRQRRPGVLQQMHTVQLPNGTSEQRVIQRWTYPVTNRAGEVGHIIEIIKDVTEHEQLAAAERAADVLREADRLKSELLGTVSHELRSPLTMIKGYTATLLKYHRRLPEDERREFLNNIAAASDRLSVIIERLLEMSRLETGMLRLQFTPVDVVQLAREALSESEVVARAAGGPSIVASLRALDENGLPTTSLPLVAADRVRLREVLDSVLENARKYSPQGGTITITARRVSGALDESGGELADGSQMADVPPGLEHAALSVPEPVDGVEICIRDTGMGIPADHLGHIFERFHRVDTRLTREVSGLGLGLALCKRIVELHGGKIWAQSQPGEGSAFYIVLPVADEYTSQLNEKGVKNASEEDEDSSRGRRASAAASGHA